MAKGFVFILISHLLLWIRLVHGLPAVNNIDKVQTAGLGFIQGSPQTLSSNNDPFYVPPQGYESSAPGTILRSRKVPGELTIFNIAPLNIQNGWQLLYRTQDSLGAPTATVVTVLQPYNSKPDHLFSLQYFVDSSDPACAPSLSLQQSLRVDRTIDQTQIVTILSALQQGYYVSIADDAGPKAAFGSGLQFAYANLDGIRAVLASQQVTGLSPSALTTMSGYSGGALAGVWAAELQRTYAPELKIAGGAFGGLVPDLSVSTAFTQGTYVSGLAQPGIMGISHDYQNLSDWVSENVKPELRNKLYATNSLCLASSEPLYAFENIGDYFQGGYQSLSDPVPASVFEATGVQGLRGAPIMPLYIFETKDDDVSPVNETDALVNTYCSQGANLFYERNDTPGVVHVIEFIVGLPGSFAWLMDVHNGVVQQGGCTQVTYPSKYSQQAQQENILGDTLQDLLNGFLGRPIGPNVF